jgi:hypothetical protein
MMLCGSEGRTFSLWQSSHLRKNSGRRALNVHHFLVFGDLHGRVLPAFRLATAWAREHQCPIAGLLQVGDLGFYPDLTRLDKATLRHAKDDPTELGVQDVIQRTEIAEAVFAYPECPPGLWFTAGNHEDYDALAQYGGSTGRQPDFEVDAYSKLRCFKNGHVVEFEPNLTVGALWGVDGEGPNRRTNLPTDAYISGRRANELLARTFRVLLTHDAPKHTQRPEYGSEIVSDLISLARPSFAFFGHYKGAGQRVDGIFGSTQVYHMAGMELHGPGGSADPGSVGVLSWDGTAGQFEYVDLEWLKTFTRHNWKWR